MRNAGDLDTPAKWNAWVNDIQNRARAAGEIGAAQMTIPLPAPGKRRLPKGDANWQDARRSVRSSPKKQKRNCLKHGGPFMSDGPHNRVCLRCKQGDDWQFGFIGSHQDGQPVTTSKRRET